MGEHGLVIDLLVKITKFMVHHIKDPGLRLPEFENYQLERKRKIMLEELLKILVDCPVLMKEFVKTVLQQHGDDLKTLCQSINPYHKLLECLLMLWANKKEGHDVEHLETEIDDCFKTYEDAIDPMHVIFLFRQMEFYDGIKSFSQ